MAAKAPAWKAEKEAADIERQIENDHLLDAYMESVESDPEEQAAIAELEAMEW